MPIDDPNFTYPVIKRGINNPNSFVSNVQYGSATIISGVISTTVNISPVDPSMSYLEFLGFTSTITSSSANIVLPRISLSSDGTSVTVERALADIGTVSVNFAVITGSSLFIDSVQQGTISVASASGSVSISPVDLSRSAVFSLGNTATNSGTAVPRRFALTLSNSSTVQANSNSTPTTAVIGFVVVQWKASVIKSVQQFSNAFTTANAVDTQAINAVDVNNSMIVWAGVNNGGSGEYEISIASSTSVNLSRVAITTASRTPRYAIVEFMPGVIVSSLSQSASFINTTGLIQILPLTNPAKNVLTFNGWRNTSTDGANLLFSKTILQVTNPSEEGPGQLNITSSVNSSSASDKGLAYQLILFN